MTATTNQSQATRVRVLIVTRNLPPLVGGMERLNWHMADELSKQAEVRVIGPAGSAATKPQRVQILEAPLKPLLLFLLVAGVKSAWNALRWRPDIILAGSGLTAPIAWLASKLCGARSAAYLHGFDITVNNGLYKRLWVPTFKRVDRIIVNSTPTQRLALAAGVLAGNTSIVHPGVSLPSQAQPPAAIAAFRQQHGLAGKKILLSVGRLTTRKGLKEFVLQALPAIVQQEPEAVLVVVGDAPKNSLGAGIQSRASIEEVAAAQNLGQHVKFLGIITDPVELATAYQAASVHVFPVRHIPDDPEGFGMVAVEAAAHGTPTVAFATGGIVDAVFQGQSGLLVPPGDYPALAQGIIHVLADDAATWHTSARAFARQFSWPQFGRQMRAALLIEE